MPDDFAIVRDAMDSMHAQIEAEFGPDGASGPFPSLEALDRIQQENERLRRERDEAREAHKSLSREYRRVAYERDLFRTRIQQLENAIADAHGILQFNHGDTDPHIRSACDLLWTALSNQQEEG